MSLLSILRNSSFSLTMLHIADSSCRISRDLFLRREKTRAAQQAMRTCSALIFLLEDLPYLSFNSQPGRRRSASKPASSFSP